MPATVKKQPNHAVDATTELIEGGDTTQPIQDGSDRDPRIHSRAMPEAVTQDSAGRACFLTFGDLARLSQLLGYNVRSPLDIIMQCEKLSQIRTENIEIVFEPGLLQRLQSRCPKGIEFSRYLKEQVTRWAHDAVGW